MRQASTYLRRLLRLLVCGLWLAHPAPARAQEQTQIRFNPAAGQVALNQTLAVAVEVQDVTDLYGVDITVAFDPAVVEVQDSYPDVGGTQIAQGTLLEPGFVLINTVDNQAGTAHFAMTQLNPSPAKNGSGSLIVLTLRGKKAGAASSLIVSAFQLAARAGTEIPATVTPGQVQVVSQPAQGASNTPVPTVGAGTVFPSLTPVPASQATAPPFISPTPRATSTTAPGQPSATPAPTATPGAGASATAGDQPAAGQSATTVPAQAGATASGAPGAALAPTFTPAQAAGVAQAVTATPWTLGLFPTRTEAPAGPGGTAAPGQNASGSPGAPQGPGGGLAWAAGGLGLGALALIYLARRRARGRK